jgi:YesN/AraC family two-component response regulator
MKSWHFHPEIELVCVPHGKGQLYIGNRQYSYENGAVILLNSNIPHKSFDLGFESELYEEYVLQITPNQLEILFTHFPEFEKIKQLIKVSQEALVLPLTAHEKVFREKFQALLESHSLRQWLIFVEVLDELSRANYEVLGVTSGNINSQQAERVEKVFEFIEQHYTENISSQTIANLLHLTDTSFCRFFQKHTQKTFKQVLNEYRVTQACKLLSFTDKSIENIAYETGYNNQSFFNRVFKEVMHTTPMNYRKERQGLKS